MPLGWYLSYRLMLAVKLAQPLKVVPLTHDNFDSFIAEQKVIITKQPSEVEFYWSTARL
jgi:hypothetical protein